MYKEHNEEIRTVPSLCIVPLILCLINGTSKNERLQKARNRSDQLARLIEVQ